MTYYETIHNVQTDKTTQRNYTLAEIAELEQGEIEAAARTAYIEAKTAAKASALAKLAALGLSADEIAAL